MTRFPRSGRYCLIPISLLILAQLPMTLAGSTPDWTIIFGSVGQTEGRDVAVLDNANILAYGFSDSLQLDDTVKNYTSLMMSQPYPNCT